MYRYAQTRSRVHRVIVEGGKAFKIEQCNLDDVAFLRLQDTLPEGQHCAYCWAGYVEPTEEEKKEDEAEAAAEKEQIPPDAKPVALVTSTRRMAAAVLVGALLLGTAAGVLASPDPNGTAKDGLALLRDRVDDLVIEVRVLQADLDGHVHAMPSNVIPLVIVIPTPNASDTQQVINPSPTPVVLPSATPTGTSAADNGTSAADRASGADTHSTTSTTTIIVIPPIATSIPVLPGPTPPPAPTATPCVRPGIAYGAGDPCRWPHN